MPHLSAARLLNAWERGRRRSGVERAMLLLCACEPEASQEGSASLPIQQRDARILALRASMFGPRLDAVVNCPGCGESLEFSMAVADLPLRDGEDLPETLSVSTDGYEIVFRLPTSDDVVNAARGSGTGRHLALLERCILEARRGDTSILAESIPEPVVAEMLDRMAALDRATTLEVSLSCPSCGGEWQTPFDVVSFVWAEVDAWAVRTLDEVRTLASAYGWSEADILAMSAWRRHHYMQMEAG